MTGSIKPPVVKAESLSSNSDLSTPEHPQHGTIEVTDFNDSTKVQNPSESFDEKTNGVQTPSEDFDEKTNGVHPDELLRELSRIDTSDYPGAFATTMIVIALFLNVLLSALDMTIVATAIPRITDQFHSLDSIGWIGSAFFLTIGSFQSTWGKIYKYFPLKIAFLTALFIFELGSLICGVAPNSTTLIIGRAVAGVGGAGIASGGYTIIAFIAPPAKRPAFTGVLGAAFGVGSVIGPLLGGVFTDHLSWRWCFYINLPIGGITGAFILFFFHTPKAARPQSATWREKLLQLDIPGTFILMAAIICYLLAMQWGGTTKSWSDGSVIALLVLFGVLVLTFIAVEYISGDRALLQGRLLKDRTISAMSAYIFIAAGGFFILLYYLPVYFQVTRNVSAAESGIRNLPLVIAASLGSIASGVIITVTGQYIPVMLFGSVITSIATGLLYTLNLTSGPGAWIGYQTMAGIGLGLIFQIPVIVAQAMVKPSDLSSVSAMILFFQTIGGAIWISGAQAAFVNTMLKTLPKTAPTVNPGLVIATGATELRKVLPAEAIPGVLVAYMDGLRVPFIICIALAVGATILNFAPKWQSLKGKMPSGGVAA